MSSTTPHLVPNLTTALSGPLMLLESHFLDNQTAIEAWLRQQWLKTPAPIYSSVDLRNAGFKLAPVDTNLFPAGFNNLNPAFMPLCIQALQSAVEHSCREANGILLVPENHTRNLNYLESLKVLQQIIERSGFACRIGTLREDISEATPLELPSGGSVVLEPLERTNDRLHIGGFDPCMILLNNDLSGGRPPILEHIKQPISPILDLGWSSRLKSSHFARYQDVAREFSEIVKIDPWLIDPMFRNCGEIDFMKREGEDCLVKNASTLLTALRLKYKEYGIKDDPFIVVKSDTGTYGMGVMIVKEAEQLRSLNRKQRTKMATIKEGQTVSQAIIQEGVYTFETLEPDDAVAEPVVYMIDHSVVGGFYRVHTGRGSSDNLNAPGMHFQPLAFAESCLNPDETLSPHSEPNRFYAYGVVGRLALLAAARELSDLGHLVQDTRFESAQG